jgi:GNAT superfamily N-acetyltransferase
MVPIRPGSERDWRALRMLLPEAFHYGSGARALVATSEDGLRIVGAAAVSPRLRSEPALGPRVAVHVIPPCRRRGIGQQLVEACAAAAGNRAAALYAWQPVPAQSDDAQRYRQLGFDRTVTLLEGHTEVERAFSHLNPLYEQVVERGWIPPEARLAPLDAGHAAQIARLHVDYLGGQYEQIIAAVRGELPLRYVPDLSPVLLVEGQIRGFTLARMQAEGIAAVDATVVHPAFRRGWANLWLKFAGACACRDLGIHTLLFYTYDRHTDTRKISRQVGGTIVEMVEPYMRLPRPPRPADGPRPDAPADHIPEPR